ncbi:hypothetical protein HQ560_10435 [bacterium]|nr:hypothetical protein [bacterium]
MDQASAPFDRDPGKALLLSWLLPGAGHWYTARPGRALLYFSAVVGIFAIGLVMGGLSTISVVGHKWAFLLQVFNGPITLTTALLGHPEVAAKLSLESATAMPPPSRMADLGLTCTLVSAAFNILVMADAYYLADKPLDAAPGDSEDADS